MRQFKQKLTYSNVISTLCLFLILGGGAYAMSSAPKNSVTSRSIKNGAVKSADLAANSVNGTKVADGSLSGADLSGPVTEASHSINADHALTAVNADKLNGLASSALYPSANVRSFDFAARGCSDATDSGCSADFSLGGLSLTAECFVNGGSNPELDVVNTSATATFGSEYVVLGGPATSTVAGPNSGLVTFSAPTGDKVVQGSMLNLTNATETANFAADAYDDFPAGAGCDVWLFALRSG